MKIRRFAGAAAVIITALVGSPALADTWLGDTASLKNANPTTVEAWLEKLLGGQPATLIFESQGSVVQYPSEWKYAVVKYGGNYVAYWDYDKNPLLDNNHLLDNIGSLKYDISNVRFFVPEPTALLLLGTGLVAAAPFVWSRRRRA